MIFIKKILIGFIGKNIIYLSVCLLYFNKYNLTIYLVFRLEITIKNIIGNTNFRYLELVIIIIKFINIYLK